MTWWGRILGLVGLGGGVAYATGFDQVIYRTLINFGSAVFCYLLASVMNLLSWLLDQLPDIDFSPDFVNGMISFLIFLSQLNTFFPVVEFFSIFSFVISFNFISFVVKRFLKLIPFIG